MRNLLTASAAAAVAAATLTFSSASAADGPVVDKRATLPAIDLADVQPSLGNDRGVNLGGIGSGLFKVSNTDYWTVTDRGPNGDVAKSYAGNVAAQGDKSFVLPEFTPHLVKIRVRGTQLIPLQYIPIMAAPGVPATGLPNSVLQDNGALGTGLQAWLSDWDTQIDYNPNGLDTEGVVQVADGSFWVVDEYGPSIAHIAATGQVIERHVPAGSDANYVGAAYPIVDSLPAEFSARRGNRGFEDIALLPDGHTVVVALQSPYVEEPKPASVMSRLLVFDTATGDDVRTYDYTFEDTTPDKKKDVGGWPADTKAKDLKISAVVPIDQTHVLVEERTDDVARFYRVTLPTDGTAVTEKTLFAKLDGVAGVPGKIEGAALKSKDTLVIISDNDFGFNVTLRYSLGADIVPSGIDTVFAEIKLP